MKPNRLLTALVLASAVLTAMPGCQLFAPPTTSTVQLTPEQQQARNETRVRTASSLATSGALFAVDDKDTASTAKVINTVAGGALAIAANDALDLQCGRGSPCPASAGCHGAFEGELHERA